MIVFVFFALFCLFVFVGHGVGVAFVPIIVVCYFVCSFFVCFFFIYVCLLALLAMLFVFGLFHLLIFLSVDVCVDFVFVFVFHFIPIACHFVTFSVLSFNVMSITLESVDYSL